MKCLAACEGKPNMNGVRFSALVLLATAAPVAWAYDYDKNDPAAGAGPKAPWRAIAQWDQVDEQSTLDIHQFTTAPEYLTPMVSYVPEDASVPSPRDVLGYIAGAEGHLTRPEDTIRYFQALADASPNVDLIETGTSEEGRPFHLVIISDAANLARLDEFKGYTRALSDPRKTNDATATDIFAKAKPIMHITAGLHSPETGPPEMVMELAYRLAVSKHPDIERIRKEVVVLITPVTDVDGRAEVVDWYYRHTKDYDDADYAPAGGPPYWGYYAFHDNNRDGIQMSLKLTQTYVDQFYEWHPVYSLDLHESVPLIYVSGGTGPYNVNVDPITVREWQMFAHYELAELQRFNVPGAWTWGFYDGWNPSYLLWITNNHNSMGRFYETFGNSSARTMERDLSTAEFAGKPVTERMWYNADPPPKKLIWSLRNNTNYMQSAALASLRLLSNTGREMLENFYQKGKNNMRAGVKDKPHAWVIPAEEQDPVRLSYLINQLQRHAIEVHRATRDFEVKEGKFKAGDFIVRLDQPYGRHAKNLLESQEFPKTPPEIRPYDDVSWTLGYLYRVKTTKIEDKAVLEVKDLELLLSPLSLSGKVDEGDPEAYAISQVGSNGLIEARVLLGNQKVLAANEAFKAGDVEYPAGTWIIAHQRGLRGKLVDVAKKTMLNFHALAEMPTVPTHTVDLPRLALYHTWVSTQPDGWIRMTFDKAGVPYTYISDQEIRQGGLRGKFDVILVADQGGADAKILVHGRDPKFGPIDYRPTREFPAHGHVDSGRDITRGMGFEGVAELQKFLDEGGTLMLLGSSGKLATDFGLVRNVSTSAAKVDTPGSSLQTMVTRRDHPITYGYEDTNWVQRGNGPLYSVPKKFDHWIVLKYGTKPLREDEDDEKQNDEEKTAETAKTEDAPKSDAAEQPADATKPDETKKDDEKTEEKPKDKGKFLQSGFVEGQETLEKSAAIVDIPRIDGGRVILYSFNPMHRYLNHGDFNYVYNALLHWNDFQDGKPLDHPKLVKD